jgi:hypothetical protein
MFLNKNYFFSLAVPVKKALFKAVRHFAAPILSPLGFFATGKLDAVPQIATIDPV